MGYNPKEYEEVKDRIVRFYEDHPDGRIITENLTTLQDRTVSTWVMKASVYFDWEELARATPRATGHAFEVDSERGVNATSALENCETSAIGRALANAGYSGVKRPSREEMQKVERAVKPLPVVDWKQRIEALTNRDEALALYNQARSGKAPQFVMDEIAAKGKSFG